MKDYSAFPPVQYFVRVLKNCPKSAFLYVQLWNKKSKSYLIAVSKKDIRKDYLISPTMFRNLLAPMAFLSLIRLVEDDEKFQIALFGSGIDE